MNEVEDVYLVENCLQGDIQSFEILVNKYQKPIFNAALRLCNDFDNAQDIAQSAFVKAYDKLEKFNPKYKFFSWIYRIVINEAINFLHQNKKRQELDDNIILDDNSPEQEYEQSEINEKIRDALMQIEPNYRILIELKHFQNCSYSEIGYILDIPEKKVKSRLYTARQALGKVLLKIGIK